MHTRFMGKGHSRIVAGMILVLTCFGGYARQLDPRHSGPTKSVTLGWKEGGSRFDLVGVASIKNGEYVVWAPDGKLHDGLKNRLADSLDVRKVPWLSDPKSDLEKVRILIFWSSEDIPSYPGQQVSRTPYLASVSTRGSILKLHPLALDFAEPQSLGSAGFYWGYAIQCPKSATEATAHLVRVRTVEPRRLLPRKVGGRVKGKEMGVTLLSVTPRPSEKSPSSWELRVKVTAKSGTNLRPVLIQSNPSSGHPELLIPTQSRGSIHTYVSEIDPRSSRTLSIVVNREEHIDLKGIMLEPKRN